MIPNIAPAIETPKIKSGLSISGRWNSVGILKIRLPTYGKIISDKEPITKAMKTPKSRDWTTFFL